MTKTLKQIYQGHSSNLCKFRVVELKLARWDEVLQMELERGSFKSDLETHPCDRIFSYYQIEMSK